MLIKKTKKKKQTSTSSPTTNCVTFPPVHIQRSKEDLLHIQHFIIQQHTSESHKASLCKTGKEKKASQQQENDVYNLNFSLWNYLSNYTQNI